MTNRLVVSDHAAMRWLERGVGFDINMLKRTVADALDNAFQAAEKLGVSNYLILAAGQVFVVRDGTLVTVMADDSDRLHMLIPSSPHAERNGK
jgi:hypothetical protein